MLTTGYGTILFHTIGDHGVEHEMQRTAVAEEAFRNHAGETAPVKSFQGIGSVRLITFLPISSAGATLGLRATSTP